MASVWDDVVGQERAVAQLTRSAAEPVHAYLFVGPPGSTKFEAARAFAALTLTGSDDPALRDARLALAGEHPDVREITRVGAALSAEQITDVVRTAAMRPVEGNRTVLLLDEAHLLAANAAARLLKTIEEPPPSTIFVVLADHVPPDLGTIASRCVRIEFSAIDPQAVENRLVAEGVDPERARTAALASAGSFDRARVLAHDDELAHRRDVFARVPGRLDGNGCTVAAVAEELIGLVERSAQSLVAGQAAEIAALEERVAAMGERGSGRKALEERHKREARRHRIDELRSGLAVMAATYRDALVAGRQPRDDALARAVSRIHASLESLERNPNEMLLLQALLLDLPGLDGEQPPPARR